MATTFSDVFASYYILYRGDSTVPDTSDPEWLTGVSLANTAIKSWARDNAVLWRELWTTNQTLNAGQTLASGTLTYTVPTITREIGSNLRVTGPSANGYFEIPIVDIANVRNVLPGSMYAYVTGNPHAGFVLNIPGMAAAQFGTQYAGWTLDYDIYKKANVMTLGTDASSIAAQQAFLFEMNDPEYAVQMMLANRFRASRNWSGYQTALRDAQNALKQMENENARGVPGSDWNLDDNDMSGTFGI